MVLLSSENVSGCKSLAKEIEIPTVILYSSPFPSTNMASHRTSSEIPDGTTWKLCILKCLQQTRGLFGQAIEFDIMENNTINRDECIVRVHFQDRIHFAECVASGTFDEEQDETGNGVGNGRCLRIVSQSAFLGGVITERTNWA